MVPISDRMPHMLSLVIAAAAPTAWFGPSTIALGKADVANPYDWQNRPEVVLRQKETQLVQQAFYDQGEWKARAVLPAPGSWTAQLQIKGQPVGQPRAFTVNQSLKHKGFIRIDKKDLTFTFDDGSGYFPIGFNLGWGSPQVPLEPLIAKMGAEGLNWGRVWACHWDGKNPHWPMTDPKPGLGRMDPRVFARWDGIVEAAEKADLNFQFVLFHHGPYSSRVNSNWGEHPWNVKNGGFLEKPGAFFTNQLAKNLARSWLREAVARWGYSPSVMAWELFNEVEWVDNRYDNRMQEVTAWHREMTAYLKEIDPVGRLVTTSSDMELPIYADADYYQPHGYVPSVEGLVLGQKMPKDKPLFFGEIGPNGESAAEHRLAARDGLWTGFLAGHPGAAQYWYWDRVERDGILKEAGASARFIKDSGLLDDAKARPIKLNLQAPTGGDLKLIPGKGWARTDVASPTFSLPQDAGKFGGVSNYFQGRGKRDMHPETLSFNFDQRVPGRVTLATGPASLIGGTLELWVNGKKEDSITVPASESSRTAGRDLTATTPVGKVKVEVKSTGEDWIQVTSITFSGIAPAVTALAYGSSEKVMTRLKKTRVGSATVRISGLPLSNGPVQLAELNLTTGLTRFARSSVTNGSLRNPWNVSEADSVLLITRR